MSRYQKDNSQLVFIIGSGRSGTTLLRNILENHPQIGVTPELRFFDLILADRKKFKDLTNNQTKEKFIEFMFRKIYKSRDPMLKSVKLDSKLLKEELFRCNDYKEMFLVLAEFTSSRKNPAILIEKTPGNIFFLEQILEFFPQAKFIHTLRDGREFCASAKKRKFGKTNINLIVWWKESLRAFDEIQKKFSSKKNDFLEIKYEDLTQNPKQVLNQIFSFLDIDVVSEDFLKSLQNLPSYSSFFETSKAGLYQSKHFQEYFSVSEQEEIESLLYPVLKKRGYSVIYRKLGIFLQLRLLLETLKLRINLWSRKKGYFWLYFRVKKNTEFLRQ